MRFIRIRAYTLVMPKSPIYLTVSSVSEMLKTRQGSMSNVAYASKLGVSPQFLSDVYRGIRGPSKEILDTLGLERVICYTKK